MRRRLTINRLDPWSVLKFSAVANIVLFAVIMLISGVVWFVIDQLQLVDQACELALDIGFTACGIEAGSLFQALALLGAMGIIVATAVMVFCAFLFNLIADLTGGITVGAGEEVTTDEYESTEQERTGQRGTAAAGATIDRGRQPDNRMAQPRGNAGRGRSAGDERAGDPTQVRQQAPRQAPARPRGEGEQLFGDR